MKQLLATVLSLLSVTVLYGANPSYDAFIGTNGIIVSSNPPQGRVIIDGFLLTNGLGGGTVSFANLLWTNQPAGRIRPIEFTNRVELQRVLVIGTNYASYAGAVNSNDFLFAYRDITKGERWGPRFEIGVFSNSVASRIFSSLNHNSTALDIVTTDEGANSSSISMSATANNTGPSLTLTRTNGVIPFAVSGTNITLHNVQYTFPQAQGSAGTVLTNNGAGVLGWGTAGAGGGLTTNENQFLGVPLSIKDSALLTNTVNRGIGLLGTETNILTAPQFLGTNVVFDGSLSSWFQFNPATGPETNYVFTNIAAGQTIRLATFVTNGTTVRLKVDTTDIPAAWYFGNNGLAANLNSNSYSLVTISRDSLIPTTNVLVTTRDLELVGGANITLTTNFPAGTVSIASTGGGTVGFNDLVWTNAGGVAKMVSPSTAFSISNDTANGIPVAFVVNSTNGIEMVEWYLQNFETSDQGGVTGVRFLMDPGEANDNNFISTISSAAVFHNNAPTGAVRAIYKAGGVIGGRGVGNPTDGQSIGLLGDGDGTGAGNTLSYGVVGNANGANTNVGVASTAFWNDPVDAVGIYAEVTATTITEPAFENAVHLFDNRETGFNLLVGRTNNGTTVFRVDGVGDIDRIKGITYDWPSAQGAAGTVLTNNGSGVLGWGAGPTGSGVLSGTTNFFNLSVQAAKLPATNYPAIDGGWQAWETVYSETNAEGNRATLDASWQFMVPTDYAPNSLKLLINYSLLATNGPNTSNVVWGASILSIRSGTTNNVHTNSFGAYAKGSNDWIAKYDGTNIVTNLVINLDSSGLQARDLSVIKVGRFSTEDTYGGAVSLHGLQLEYTRP